MAQPRETASPDSLALPPPLRASRTVRKKDGLLTSLVCAHFVAHCKVQGAMLYDQCTNALHFPDFSELLNTTFGVLERQPASHYIARQSILITDGLQG